MKQVPEENLTRFLKNRREEKRVAWEHFIKLAKSEIKNLKSKQGLCWIFVEVWFTHYIPEICATDIWCFKNTCKFTNDRFFYEFDTKEVTVEDWYVPRIELLDMCLKILENLNSSHKILN